MSQASGNPHEKPRLRVHRPDPDKLIRQAPVAIEAYLAAALEVIDARFGKGYAAHCPALVGAFIQAAASDYAARTIADALENLATSV